MQCTINVTIQMWYYLKKQTRSLYIYIYIYIYIYTYIHNQIPEILYITSKLVFKEYLTPNVMQIIKFHTKGTVDIMFTNIKVLLHLGDKSHNLNKLNNNAKTI